MFKVIMTLEFETEEDKDGFLDWFDSREDLNYASYEIEEKNEEE